MLVSLSDRGTSAPGTPSGKRSVAFTVASPRQRSPFNADAATFPTLPNSRIELLASTFVYTLGDDLLSLVVVDVHNPFPIRLLKSHIPFQCSCWKSFEVALATR